MVDLTEVKARVEGNFLDARGLSCPLPLLKMKLALKTMEASEKLRVLTTDEGSVRDFKAFCELAGHLLEELTVHDDYFEFLIINIIN